MSQPEDSPADIEGEEPQFWERLDEDAGEPADWAGDELEEAYLKAMEVLEATDAQFPEWTERPDDAPEDDSAPVEQAVAAGTTIPNPERISPDKLASELNELSQSAAPVSNAKEPSTNVTPRQIVEALLFVGGEALTTKKLSHVLRGEFSAEFIEAQIEELNTLYQRQGRPYEIRFGDGGYRLTLRDDFEKIRRKVFGLGPKEVKLTQDALEVMAVVAYHQPITAAQIEELGKPGCGAVLRQLLRRELIRVERTSKSARDVAYRTTPRFLSLFGLRNLNELPRMEQVVYK